MGIEACACPDTYAVTCSCDFTLIPEEYRQPLIKAVTDIKATRLLQGRNEITGKAMIPVGSNNKLFGDKVCNLPDRLCFGRTLSDPTQVMTLFNPHRRLSTRHAMMPS
jgi:hypothetical protein